MAVMSYNLIFLLSCFSKKKLELKTISTKCDLFGHGCITERQQKSPLLILRKISLGLNQA